MKTSNGHIPRELHAVIQFYAGMQMQMEPTVYSHQQRVSALAREIGRKLGLSSTECELLRISGLLHDVGKNFLPAGFLHKPGALTRQEREVMKAHPRTGYDFLRGFAPKLPDTVLIGVLEHHERVDGSGYPSGKDTLSLFGGILGVADYFEARQEPRPYRSSSLTRREAINATVKEPFHPDVLVAFCKIVGNGNGKGCHGIHK